MDELKTKIDLQVLTEDKIKEQCLLPQDLWMVQVPGEKALGPYHTKDLKDYSHKYQYLFEKAQVYSLDTDEWKDMFSVSKFQRRKPQLISAHNLMEDQEIYILFKGQKNGPHTVEKVQGLLDENQIKTTTQISLDKGNSWIKLYEYHAFDRRNSNLDLNLPLKPEAHVLKSVKALDSELEDDNVTEQMLIELSLMRKRSPSSSQKKSKKHSEESKPNKVKASKISVSRGRSGWKYGVSASLVLVFAVMLFNSRSQVDFSRFRAEVPTNIKGINNSSRDTSKRIPASIAPIKQVIKKKLIQKRPAPIKRYRAKKRAPAYKPRKVVEPKRLEETFESDIENIDIDDPEIQEELSRQIANEEESEVFDNQHDENIENAHFGGYDEDAEQYDDELDEEESYNPEERITHEAL